MGNEEHEVGETKRQTPYEKENGKGNHTGKNQTFNSQMTFRAERGSMAEWGIKPLSGTRVL
jgi:hypothetical protein